MTRLFTDGAENGDMSRAATTVGSVSASTTQKRTGSRSYALSSSVSVVANSTFLLLSAANEWYLRFAVYAGDASAQQMVIFLNGANTAGSIRTVSFGNSSATCSVYDGTTIRATSSTYSMNAAEWHVFEVYYKHAASPNGRIIVKFDGVIVIDFSGATDTQPQTDRIQIRNANGNAIAVVWYYDDIAVNDINGVRDNTWVGDGGILSALVPTSTGTYVGFLASGSATTWQSIDEIPANSTDFIYTSVSGTISTFNTSSSSGLPAGASISRIWVELYAKETAAAGDKIATLLRSGVTNVTGTSQNLTTAFARYESAEYLTNPDTSGTWSIGEVNSVQIGVIAE